MKISWISKCHIMRHEFQYLSYIFNFTTIMKIMKIGYSLKKFKKNSKQRKKNLGTEKSGIFFIEKIWCASRARVNLPHIGDRKWIIFFYNDFFDNTQDLTFLSRNLYLYAPFGYQISKFWVCSFVPGPHYNYQKCRPICSTVKFDKQNSRFLPFLGEICMMRYP
jgi:hypothetical protein